MCKLFKIYLAKNGTLLNQGAKFVGFFFFLIASMFAVCSVSCGCQLQKDLVGLKMPLSILHLGKD